MHINLSEQLPEKNSEDGSSYSSRLVNRLRFFQEELREARVREVDLQRQVNAVIARIMRFENRAEARHR